MHQVMKASCQIEHDEEGGGPSVRGICCEARQCSHLPDADARTVLDAVFPPMTLPPADLPRVAAEARLSPPATDTQPLRPARYGPSRAGPRSAAARCVTLCVMHC
jgi:hypothetical protein